MDDAKVKALKQTVEKIEKDHPGNPAGAQLTKILNERIDQLERQAETAEHPLVENDAAVKKPTN